jgi:hypothetical protein
VPSANWIGSCSDSISCFLAVFGKLSKLKASQAILPWRTATYLNFIIYISITTVLFVCECNGISHSAHTYPSQPQTPWNKLVENLRHFLYLLLTNWINANIQTYYNFKYS